MGRKRRLEGRRSVGKGLTVVWSLSYKNPMYSRLQSKAPELAPGGCQRAPTCVVSPENIHHRDITSVAPEALSAPPGKC